MLITSSYTFQCLKPKKLLCALLLTFSFCLLVKISSAPASVLSDAANALSPGQSIKITTNNLISAADTNDTGTTTISWANTGVWCPFRHKAIFVGKAASNLYRYYRLEYDEASNTWDVNGSLHSDLMSNQSGHGYDGTAIDPDTGNIYVRRYGDPKSIFMYTRTSDSWAKLPAAPGSAQIAEALEYWHGRGVVFSDFWGVRLWNGTKWSTLVTSDQLSPIGYHSIGEYQPNADVYVFGGGNSAPKRLYRLDSDNLLTLLSAAPIGLGNSQIGQGILVHDPSSNVYIAWDQASSWHQLDPLENSWLPLNACSGDGSLPASGTPNFSDDQSIAIPIPAYGVVMFAGRLSNDVWIYKHAELETSIQSFKIRSATSGAQIPFTAGLAFKKGDVLNTPTLDLSDYQVIVKKRWNDNSIKHAIVSGHTNLTASTPKTITVHGAGSVPSGTALTASDIKAANPSASIQCGNIGTVSLSDLLDSPARTWISGPEMVEAHYQSAVGSDATLVAKFQVRLYKNNAVWIRAIVENGALDAVTSAKHYAPQVTVGSAVVYDNGAESLSHHAHTRWSAEGWIGITDPDITIDHDATYLMASGLVPNYWKTHPSSETLNGLNQTYTPMQQGNWTQDMGAGGFQNQIGLLPLWDALYLNSGGDHRAYQAVIANAHALNSYPIVWSDSATDRPIALSNWETWTISGENGGGATSYGAGSLTWDIAHHGSGGYLAYLITGDPYHLETMLYQSALCYLMTSSARGTGTSRLLMPVQTRGVAWSMRTVGQAAAIAPSDPMANDLQAWLSSGGADYYNSKCQMEGQNELGYIYAYNFGAYDTGTLAPWQQHFWIQTMGYLSDLEPLSEMTQLNAMRDHMYKAIVGILGASGEDNYCYTQASAYTLTVSNANNDPVDWYDAWGTVWDNNHGTPNTSCGDTLEGGSAGAPSAASKGYWGNLLPAIAYAVDDGAPGASAAWARLSGASNWQAVETSGFEDTPIWGIVPRSDPGVAPTCDDGIQNNEETGVDCGGPYCAPCSSGGSAPLASCSSDPSPAAGTAPLTIRFTDTSSGEPTTWEWDFDGDGQTDSEDQHPEHTYTDAGNFTVSLTVSNDVGQDTLSMTVTVTGTADPPTTDQGSGGGGGCFIDAMDSTKVVFPGL